MNLNQWLVSATASLKATGIGSARLDCLILIEDELKKDRAYILAHPEIPLPDLALQKLNRRLKRRVEHEPLAYIRGFSEFYGRRFLVNKTVLEPRPESETMIELLVGLVDSGKLKVNSKTTIADIGTGSGALAITAKLELPEAQVVASDIDKKCIVITRLNAKQHKADIDFLTGDLLRPLTTKSYKLSTILANLPYVPNHYKINQAAAMEPRLAIFGGIDGLDVYRRLFEQINNSKTKPDYVLTESLPPQHNRLAKIASTSDYDLEISRDFVQLFKSSR